MSTILLTALLLAADPAAKASHFAIRVVDDETGRGVPLVELRTVHGVRLFTDSAGLVTFNEPGLMDHDVFFFVSSHGYEFPKDGFGYRGKSLRTTPGGNATLRIKRVNIAQRLYRVTGAGIYRDSVLLGEKPPIKEPLLNGQVLGSDSVLNAVYRGKVYWVWGDTNQPRYPLGNFHVPAATSQLPATGGLSPDRGVDLSYFVDDRGFAKAVCKIPGVGPTWITSLVTLTGGGRERLYASYVKVEPPLKVYARGLAAFNDDREEFERAAEVEMAAPAFPSGHALRHTEGGVDYVYFAHPYPLTRVRASGESFLRIADYECYTCLKSGSRLGDDRLADAQIDRDAAGRAVYAWRKNTPAVGPAEQAKLIARGKLKADEALLRLRDRDTGKPVTAHSGSVYWNEHRRRFVMIAVEIGGTSFLGEVWYAEADTPVGPWAYAAKVVTHERYSFYNPKQHPMFDRERGQVIYFEGTYTHTFSGNSDQTPRYDYNQVMYQLDLADARLALPAPVYDVSSGDVPRRFAMRKIVESGGEKPVTQKPGFLEKPGFWSRVAFFALDRGTPSTVPVYASEKGLQIGRAGEGEPLFYALSPDAKSPPASVRPLYEFVRDDGGNRAYSTDGKLSLAGYRRVERPFCLVW
jgi:hypothetical protein